MGVDNNPYEGREVTGVTRNVLSRGRLVVEEQKYVGKPGSGRYLRRAARSQTNVLP
jgi:dihydropyrimidinase